MLEVRHEGIISRANSDASRRSGPPYQDWPTICGIALLQATLRAGKQSRAARRSRGSWRLGSWRVSVRNRGMLEKHASCYSRGPSSTRLRKNPGPPASRSKTRLGHADDAEIVDREQ